MKTIQFVPEACKASEGKEARFEGHVEIECPKFNERYELIEKAGFEMDAEGRILTGIKQLPALRKSVELSKPFVKSVALKKIEGGVEYKSFEDLEYDPDCDEVLIEIGSQVMNGFRVSKK